MGKFFEALKDREVSHQLMGLASEVIELVGAFASSSSDERPKSEARDYVSEDVPLGITRGAQGGCDCAVPYGTQKKDGGHNHVFNKGVDRTPAQKAGDNKRRK